MTNNADFTDCDGTLDWNEKAAHEMRQEMLARRRALETLRVERETENHAALAAHLAAFGDMLIDIE